MLLAFFKYSSQTSMGYESALNDSPCFGWIDSIIRKIDKERYVWKFMPVGTASRWST